MFELLIVWLIASGCIGGTYFTIMLPAFFIFKYHRHYVVNYFEISALLAPIALYLILIHAVNDRQGFNWGYANMIIAVPAVITLYFGTWNSLAYWIGFAVTMITAFLAWWFIPEQGFTKLW